MISTGRLLEQIAGDLDAMAILSTLRQDPLCWVHWGVMADRLKELGLEDDSRRLEKVAWNLKTKIFGRCSLRETTNDRTRSTVYGIFLDAHVAQALPPVLLPMTEYPGLISIRTQIDMAQAIWRAFYLCLELKTFCLDRFVFSAQSIYSRFLFARSRDGHVACEVRIEREYFSEIDFLDRCLGPGVIWPEHPGQTVLNNKTLGEKILLWADSKFC